MKKLLILVLSILTISCGELTEKKKNDLIKDSIPKTLNTQNQVSATTIKKHQTSNQSIEAVPELIKKFIPKGYSAINLSKGDANLDGLEDIILVLRKDTEETTSDYAENLPDRRLLLLLIKQKDSSYKLTYTNENAVYCIDCGGVFGDPFTGTTIKKGYFSIEHSIAGGRHWEMVTTFKYNKEKNNWFLYKERYISYKMNDDTDENVEALIIAVDKLKTEKDFGVIPFREFNIYNKDET